MRVLVDQQERELARSWRRRGSKSNRVEAVRTRAGGSPGASTGESGSARSERSRWSGLRDGPKVGEALVARAGRSRVESLAAAVFRARTRDEVGAIVAAQAGRLWPEVVLSAVLVREDSVWRVTDAARGPRAAVAAWLAGAPDRRALLARVGRRSSPLVLTSPAALSGRAPALARLRLGRAAARAGALIPHKQEGRALGCILVGFRRPLSAAGAALEGSGMLASICAAALRRLGPNSRTPASDAIESFVGMAAHELRDPIAAALVHLRIVRRILPATDEQETPRGGPSWQLSLDSVSGELERLHRLVGFMGDATCGLYRPDTIDRVPTDLGPLIHSAARTVATNAGGAPPIRLSLDSPLWVACDAGQVERVLDSLLGSAVKHSDGTPIDVSARRMRGRVIIRVKGRGLSVGNGETVADLDRFWRGEVARAYPGLGLGLWLSRAIVEAHRGSLRVTAGPRGSVFEVSLPRLAGAAL